MQMLSPDPSPLLALRDAPGALATLERALATAGRPDESIVARELRAIGGGLDDGAHMELRSRRLAIDPGKPPPVLFDRATLRASLLPDQGHGILLDLAATLAGVESKIVKTDLAELGVSARDKLPAASQHPLAQVVLRLARMLGIERPDVVVGEGIDRARVGLVGEAPWVLLPESLESQAEPLVDAQVARVLTRIALGVPWVEELPHAYVHAVLCGAARQVAPDYAMEIRDAEQQDLVGDYAKRVGRALGRRQKKMLGELSSRLAGGKAPTVAQAEAFTRAIARAELRAAFVVTGDLLSTLDVLRSYDPAFARDAGTVGARALGATLVHGVASDTVRFALDPAATALRWRAGTLWRAAR
jgi:hypothetical protein